LIVNDQRTTFLLTSALTLAFLISSHAAARADGLPAVASNAQSAAAAPAASNAQTAPLTVAFSFSGHESTFTTFARTVGAFLAERGIHVASADYLSLPPNADLQPATRLAYRPAVAIVLIDGGTKQVVHTAAATVGDLLSQEHVTSGPDDEVFPSAAAYLVPNEVIRIDRIAAWTAHVKQRLSPRVQERFDPRLPAGTTRTLVHGSAGVRVATVRYEQRNDTPLTKRILGYRIVRAPQPRVVVHGSRPYAALQDIAAQGFAGALHFAGAALHVIATAYTSSCYGCSGYTASGARARLGIIAVDPRIIPLGTHLFIPGYGRAVAGDTGGAIRGHRVDLGFENVASAVRFGSREVTVYVVK